MDIKSKTGKRYYFELKKFLNSNKDLETFINENVKDRKQLSKLNCGLKLLNDDTEGKREALKIIKEMFKKNKKPRYQKKAEEQLKVRNVESSINRLKNKRLKIAFRLQLISGLRIEELENLTFDNIKVDEENRLIISVLDGKYGKDRKVRCLPDNWVYDNLIDLEERKNGKLFYSKYYMAHEARKRCNIHTHDLRKTFAHNKFYNNLSDNAVEEIQDDLGHNHNTLTYKKYTNRDINTTNTKWDNMTPFEERKIENG